MNERIRELAKQVDCTIDGMGYGEGDIEGLAELIVEECAGVANCNGHVHGFTLGDLIKEHFGI